VCIFPTVEVNAVRELHVWLPTFFKISSFVFRRRKNSSEWWQNTIFGYTT